MAIITSRKSQSRPKKAAKKISARVKKPFKLELTHEDIALDKAISAAAARGLSSIRKA